MKQRTFENVKEFWDQEASLKGAKPVATIRDHFFRIHELNILNSLIPAGSAVLDVGCGTGFGTAILNSKASKTLGIDYSAEMIKWADKIITDESYKKNLYDELGYDLEVETDHLEFKTQDALTPLPEQKTYNIITAQRVLINMVDHEAQLELLKNLKNYADSNTTFLLVEATLQGHENTNKIRNKFGISDLERYWRNCYVDEDRLSDWEKLGLEIKETITFDTYMLFSKVIYPAACGEDNCQFISGANKAAMEIANKYQTKEDVLKIGLEEVMNEFLDKLKSYDQDEHDKINNWLKDNLEKIKNTNWQGLGHQKLFICKLK